MKRKAPCLLHRQAQQLLAVLPRINMVKLCFQEKDKPLQLTFNRIFVFLVVVRLATVEKRWNSTKSQEYVMSGSRHARMNAVRIRKENQVYSAEEQRALALITAEENQQKEAQLLQDFRTMLKEKQKLRERAKEGTKGGTG